MLPVYGLAEATVGVSLPTSWRMNMSRVVVHQALAAHWRGNYRACWNPDDEDAVSFVIVGHAHSRRRYSDCRRQRRGSGRRQGREHSAASAAALPSGSTAMRRLATEILFPADGWLRTGDCGVFVDGELVITGPLEGHHYRQRPELLSARHRGNRG